MFRNRIDMKEFIVVYFTHLKRELFIITEHYMHNTFYKYGQGATLKTINIEVDWPP